MVSGMRVAASVNSNPTPNATAQADAQHLANTFLIALAPVLRGKDRHPAGDAEQEQDQQEENLVGKSKRSNGSFTQLPDHEHIHHVQAGGDELLERDRDGKCQHGAHEGFIAKK